MWHHRKASPLMVARNSSFYSNILKLTFLLFIFTNVLLFYYIYESDQAECLKEGTCGINKRRRTLPREKWGQTVYFDELHKHFFRQNNEWRLLSFLNQSLPNTKLNVEPELNCTSLQNIEKFQFIAAGYTKSAFKVRVESKVVTVKVVNIGGHDISTCMLEHDRYLYDCFLLAAAKLLKEISILRKIWHQNVVKILGYCVPVNPDTDNPQHTVAIFEEYGQAIDVIKLLQLAWEDRLRISLGLSRLLKHLSSFQEPISLNDLRRQQFVVIEGEPKLIDVDDIGLQESHCDGKPCCSTVASPRNKMVCIPCTENTCYGFNEKMNIMRTGGHFIKHILPYGAPKQLQTWTLKITNAFQFAEWNTSEIFRQMEDLTFVFKSGAYRNISQSSFLSVYSVLDRKDVSSEYDYRCQFITSGNGCAISVHDDEEAAEMCLLDSDCKAFVMTNTTTWTGRTIAYFKSGTGSLVTNNATKVYLKQ